MCRQFFNSAARTSVAGKMLLFSNRVISQDLARASMMDEFIA